MKYALISHTTLRVLVNSVSHNIHFIQPNSSLVATQAFSALSKHTQRKNDIYKAWPDL